MMDIDTLKELVRLMVDNDLSELDLRKGEETVALKRAIASPAPLVAPPAYTVAHAAPPPAAAPAAGAAAPAADPGAAIESPMVGTYYSAPDPDSPPFVQVGSVVNPNDVVCIIEAMKVFNEIKAEKAGRIARLMVENGQAVEFGQKLFLLSPA